MAAEVRGEAAPSTGSISPEVTFVAEPPPAVAETASSTDGNDPAPSPVGPPPVHRAVFRHPAARRRRVEAML